MSDVTPTEPNRCPWCADLWSRSQQHNRAEAASLAAVYSPQAVSALPSTVLAVAEPQP